MNVEDVFEKINKGQEISNIELATILLSEMKSLHLESKEDLAFFSRLVMAEFERVHSIIDKVESVMVTTSELASSLKILENRLGRKIVTSHGVTNKRIDWIQDNVKKLA